jgi:2,3-bisphosphoglycerate-dependent phosphoglycerate mutase
MSPSAARLWLIRHGQTDWNVEGRIQGQTPTELNAQGRKEAQMLADLFADNARKFAVCYASDLPRAMQTAQIVADRLTVSVTAAAALRERDFGSLEGANPAQIRAAREASGTPLTADLADWSGVRGVESDAAVYQRVAAGLREISQRHAGQDVLVVTHGGVIARVVYRSLGIPDGTPRHFPLSNGIVAVVRWHEDHFHLLTLADLPFVLTGAPPAADTALIPKSD